MKILGHDKEKEIFSRILKDDRLHHAYLLSGRDGIGKKLFARELARGIVCENGSFLEDCTCRHCINAVHSEHPDIHLIEETPLKIETSRMINNEAFMSPMSAKKKVYIIDNAETFGLQAANALLKTLEEPPTDTHFFLITDRYSQVLHTIRSRCININFGLLSDDAVREIVTPQTEADEETLKNAIAIASGSAGDALKILQNLDKQNLFKGITSKTALYEEIASLDTKEAIKTYIASLYTHLLEKYKVSGNETLLDFSNYLLDILKRLEYNVSLDMFRLDLYIKTIEVLSEKS